MFKLMQIKGMDWAVVGLMLVSVSGGSTLTCLHCKGISQPRHCKTVDDCYPWEICGVERLKNDFGETVFNVGCFSDTKCKNLTLDHDGIADCIECCRNDVCNSKGCGQPGYPENRGPICYNCNSQTNPDVCHSIAFCERGDVCKYDVIKEFGDFVYSSACSSMHECKLAYQQGPSIVGRDLTAAQSQYNIQTLRRSMAEHVCSGCCDQDLCNKGCNDTSHIKATSSDCYDIYHNNIGKTTGVYDVTLWRSKQTIQIYCDMDIPPYGWTVFQKRFNGSVNFYRNFSEYINGFGNLNGEFWLGLKFVEEMASQYSTDLRIDLTAADNEHVYESFDNFSLSPSPDFTLHVGRQTVEQIQGGNSYGFYYLRDARFSTFDHDAETDSRNCAAWQHGGWWYKDCAQANLNGQYISPPGGQSTLASGWGGFTYYAWKSHNTLKSSQIMFRKHD